MRGALFFISVMLLFLPKLCLCERVVLRSGKVVEGEMVQMDADTITLKLFGVPTTYNLSDVQSIDGKPFIMPPKLILSESSSQPEPAKQVARRTLAEKQRTPKKIGLPDVLPPAAEAQKNVDDARAYFEIGYLHQSLGEKELAEESYKKALAVDANLGQKFFNEAIEYYYLNDHSQARDKFMRAKALFEVQGDFRMIQLVNEKFREFFQPNIPEAREIEK